jgi:hypothetical protein
MIAPLLSFFFELCFTRANAGGAGEGGTPEHGFRGNPHKREFPSKEELEKL